VNPRTHVVTAIAVCAFIECAGTSALAQPPAFETPPRGGPAGWAAGCTA
jgi:hypothetical protein